MTQIRFLPLQMPYTLNSLNKIFYTLNAPYTLKETTKNTQVKCLKFKHLQTSQINFSTLKKLKSHAPASTIHSSKNHKTNKYLQQRNAPSDASEALTPRDSLCKLKRNQISRHFTCMVGL
jgi:hypothetical protein